MGLKGIRLREAVDFKARVAEIREGLVPELEQRLESAEQMAANGDGDGDEDGDGDGGGEDPPADPDELRDLRDRLEGQAGAFERTIQGLCPRHERDASADEHPCPGSECEHADATFVIQELMTAETSFLTDDVSKQELDVDIENESVDATPQQGYHKVRTLQLALAEWPDEMETEYDRELNEEVVRAGQFPDHVSDYLYDLVIALNDAGETEGIGNLSHYRVPSADAFTVSSE